MTYSVSGLRAIESIFLDTAPQCFDTAKHNRRGILHAVDPRTTLRLVPLLTPGSTANMLHSLPVSYIRCQ